MIYQILKRPRVTLFSGVLLLSMAVHLVIVFHVSGVFHFGTAPYIEIGLKDASKPTGRDIPRPRARHAPPHVAVAQDTKIQKMVPPPMAVDPVDAQSPDTLMAGIGVPQLPEVASPTKFSSADWGLSKPSDFFTKKDYFDMLRMKIETCKRYPAAARARHMEGRVKVSFMINDEGRLLSSAIITPSRNRSLDRAALRAIQDAAPFAPPPVNLFKPPLVMEITIVFELT